MAAQHWHCRTCGVRFRVGPATDGALAACPHGCGLAIWLRQDGPVGPARVVLGVEAVPDDERGAA